MKALMRCLFVGVLSAAACTPTLSLKVDNRCDGDVASGAYSVKQPTGKVIVAGSYVGGRREGDFMFFAGRGDKVAELPYKAGKLHGTLRLWHHPDEAHGIGWQRKLEAQYAAGVPHGTYTTWYPTGEDRGALVYENGNLISALVQNRFGERVDAAAARKIAQSDHAAVEKYLASLESFMAENPPVCPERTWKLDKAGEEGDWK